MAKRKDVLRSLIFPLNVHYSGILLIYLGCSISNRSGRNRVYDMRYAAAPIHSGLASGET